MLLFPVYSSFISIRRKTCFFFKRFYYKKTVPTTTVWHKAWESVSAIDTWTSPTLVFLTCFPKLTLSSNQMPRYLTAFVHVCNWTINLLLALWSKIAFVFLGVDFISTISASNLGPLWAMQSKGGCIIINDHR